MRACGLLSVWITAAPHVIRAPTEKKILIFFGARNYIPLDTGRCSRQIKFNLKNSDEFSGIVMLTVISWQHREHFRWHRLLEVMLALV